MKNRPKMRLAIFAFHVQSIALDEAPTIMRLSPASGIDVFVDIDINGLVRVNGRDVGNRQGAIQEFSRIVASVNPELILDYGSAEA